MTESKDIGGNNENNIVPTALLKSGITFNKITPGSITNAPPNPNAPPNNPETMPMITLYTYRKFI
jgi:hypothetical protein